MNYRKKFITTVAAQLTGFGFRVWIAECGTYGFYTKDGAQNIVYLQNGECLGMISFSTCTTPSSRNGTGWNLIDRDGVDTDKLEQRDFELILLAAGGQPSFIRGDITHETVESYLKRSTHSKYKEYTP